LFKPVKHDLCEFGKQAEKMRIERGMLKTELCRRIGITPTYYHYIIHGKRPGVDYRGKIIDALRMDKPPNKNRGKSQHDSANLQ